MKHTIATLFMVTALACTAGAQTVQLSMATHGTGISYRVATVDKEFSGNHLQAMYYGFPNDNEAWLGYGRDFKPVANIVVSPYVWLVVGKENHERGMGWGGTVAAIHGHADYTATYYNFTPVVGAVKAYSYLDSAEAAYAITQRFELGVSAAYFHTGVVWDPLAGPLLRINDKYGATEFTARRGTVSYEYRIARTLSRTQ